jgi:hypothetical protein
MTINSFIGNLSGDQWRRVSFYVGVPLLLGTYGAMSGLHTGNDVGFVSYLMFYLGHSMIPWWISCISTMLVTIILAPMRWPLIVRLILGGTLAGFIVMPYANWLAQINSFGGPAGATFSVLSQDFLIYGLQALLIWVGVNLLFDRFLGLPRYRYPAVNIPDRASIDNSLVHETSPSPVATNINGLDADKTSTNMQLLVPAVLQLAPGNLQPEQLLAMCAEEHYVRLITTEGEFLVYHRFSDAAKEVKLLNGLQVHRSHWIAVHGIRQVCRSAKKMVVTIDGDHQVPVSRPYQAMVLQLAERSGLTICGLPTEETYLP